MFQCRIFYYRYWKYQISNRPVDQGSSSQIISNMFSRFYFQSEWFLTLLGSFNAIRMPSNQTTIAHHSSAQRAIACCQNHSRRSARQSHHATLRQGGAGPLFFQVHTTSTRRHLYHPGPCYRCSRNRNELGYR